MKIFAYPCIIPPFIRQSHAAFANHIRDGSDNFEPHVSVFYQKTYSKTIAKLEENM